MDLIRNSLRKDAPLTSWNTLTEKKSVQLVRGASFLGDYLQNPYFSISLFVHQIWYKVFILMSVSCDIKKKLFYGKKRNPTLWGSAV